MTELAIEMFPCLADNYGFLVHDARSGATAAIDTPGFSLAMPRR